MRPAFLVQVWSHLAPHPILEVVPLSYQDALYFMLQKEMCTCSNVLQGSPTLPLVPSVQWHIAVHSLSKKQCLLVWLVSIVHWVFWHDCIDPNVCPTHGLISHLCAYGKHELEPGYHYNNKEEHGVERDVGWTGGSWKEVMVYGYDQSTLCECRTVSTIKKEEQSHKSSLVRHLL